MFTHQVIGGRLYLFNPQAKDEITALEMGWAAQEAQRLPSPSFRWTIDRLGPRKPPVGAYFRGFTPAHPAARSLYRLPQSDRQEQLARIESAATLFEQRPARYLRASGTVWVVDGQRLFVRETDRELNTAIQVRLAKGELKPPPGPMPGLPTPLATRFYRVLPVGDRR